MNAKVSIVKCCDYSPELVYEKTKLAIDLAGGITSFIKPKSRVLVKPNLLLPIGPEFGVDTHPEVVRAVVKVLKEIGCSVFIGDGPSAWGKHADNMDLVFEKTGMKRIAEEEGVSLALFDKRRWHGKFPLTTWIDDCDYLVSVPKFKTHGLTTLTGAIKNLFGFVSGTYKTELHKKYFEKQDFTNILVDIFQKAKPALTVIDGVIAMEGDGPGTSGKLRNVGLLLAGGDCVAIDSVLAVIMGLKPQDISTTKEAARRGLGTADLNSIQITGEKLEEIIPEPFKLPASTIRSKIPMPIIKLAQKLIKFRPAIKRENCIDCGSCIEACPNKLISRKGGKIVISYPGCTACFCCMEACPASAIKIKKSFLARLLKL